jgi:hypothetical protein
MFHRFIISSTLFHHFFNFVSTLFHHVIHFVLFLSQHSNDFKYWYSNVQPTIASASVGVAKNDRGMETDPTWEHDVMIDEATRVRCNYCQQEFTAGGY